MLSPLVAPSMARALSFASSENSTTMKTGDSPYMGRDPAEKEWMLPMGPLSEPESFWSCRL